jgi:hypothetical protein
MEALVREICASSDLNDVKKARRQALARDSMVKWGKWPDYTYKLQAIHVLPK